VSRCSVQLAFLIICLSTTLSAEVYVVNPDGTGDFPTIQAAVDGVVPGDYIELTDGVFRGPGNRDVLGEVFRLRSQNADPASCIIDCEGSAADPHRGFHLFGGGFGFIERITIRNGYVTGEGLDGSGGAILSRSTDFQILGCVMTNCTAEQDGGAVKAIGQTDYMASGLYDGCIFAGNTARRGGAISLGEAAMPYIDNSLLVGNLATESGGAIDAGADGGPDMTGCTISGNHALANGGGLVARFADLTRCVLWGNCADGEGDDAVVGGGVSFRCCVVSEDGVSGDPDYVNVVFVDPLFCDPVPCDDAPTTLGDYTVREDSPCLPENNICGQLIGALGEGCEVVPVRDATWGTIKKLFRH
jgi:hypothetical protein